MLYTKLLFIGLITLICSGVALAEVRLGIYLSSEGEPSLGEITVITNNDNSARLSVVVENLGNQSGSFSLKTECDKYSASLSIGNPFRLGNGERKTITINAGGSGLNNCEEMITCKVSLAELNTLNKVEKEISFKSECSLCGNEFAPCTQGSVFCEGNDITRCNKYCRATEKVTSCVKGCTMYKGNAICEEKMVKPWFQQYGIWLVLAIVILGIVFFTGYMLAKKKN